MGKSARRYFKGDTVEAETRRTRYLYRVVTETLYKTDDIRLDGAESIQQIASAMHKIGFAFHEAGQPDTGWATGEAVLGSHMDMLDALETYGPGMASLIAAAFLAGLEAGTESVEEMMRDWIAHTDRGRDAARKSRLATLSKQMARAKGFWQAEFDRTNSVGKADAFTAEKMNTTSRTIQRYRQHDWKITRNRNAETHDEA